MTPGSGAVRQVLGAAIVSLLVAGSFAGGSLGAGTAGSPIMLSATARAKRAFIVASSGAKVCVVHLAFGFQTMLATFTAFRASIAATIAASFSRDLLAFIGRLLFPSLPFPYPL